MPTYRKGYNSLKNEKVDYEIVSANLQKMIQFTGGGDKSCKHCCFHWIQFVVYITFFLKHHKLNKASLHPEYSNYLYFQFTKVVGSSFAGRQAL